MDNCKTAAWELLIRFLHENHQLYKLVMDDENAEEFKELVGRLKSHPPERTAKILHEEFQLWKADGWPHPWDDECLTAARMLCYFMSRFASSMDRIQSETRSLQ
jgi:hypothetical protein